MNTNLKTINQAEIAALLKERIENPAAYISKPLIIWRSYVHDGIQSAILRDVFREFNATKPEGDRKWYRETMLGDPAQVRADLTEEAIYEEEAPAGSRVGLYVLSPVFAKMDYDMDKSSLKGYIEALTDRKFNGVEMLADIPVAAYMCYNYDWFETPEAYPDAEQYVFEPDFELWRRHIEETDAAINKVVDFIEEFRTAEGIAYAWYNYFNTTDDEQRQGCDFPECWYDTIRRLKMILKEEHLNKFCEIPEEDFKLDCSQGISEDIVDKFYTFVKREGSGGLAIENGVITKCLVTEGEVTLPDDFKGVARNAFDGCDNVTINYSSNHIQKELQEVIGRLCQKTDKGHSRLLRVYDMSSSQIEEAIRKAVAADKESKEWKVSLVDADRIDAQKLETGDGYGILFIRNLNVDKLPRNFIYNLAVSHSFNYVNLSPNWLVVLEVGKGVRLDEAGDVGRQFVVNGYYTSIKPERFMKEMGRAGKIVEPE